MKQCNQDFLDMISYPFINLGFVAHYLSRLTSNLVQLAVNLITCNPTDALDNGVSGAIDFSSALMALVMIPIILVIAAAAIITCLFVTLICSCHPLSLLEGEHTDLSDKNSVSTQCSSTTTL
jgi:hypothetical protein